MALFSIPILRPPFAVETPKALPVARKGEQVAMAELREGSYYFNMSRGNLTDSLTQGSLLVRPRYVDETKADGTMLRKYLAIEIVDEDLFDIHRTES